MVEEAQPSLFEVRSRDCNRDSCHRRSLSPMCSSSSFSGMSLGCFELFSSSFFPLATFSRMFLRFFFLSAKLIAPMLLVSPTLLISPALLILPTLFHSSPKLLYSSPIRLLLLLLFF
ncbi:b13.3 [Ichnoviriform fugitivi]|uniref:B13.3 n=1 Tax=Ichnoviriform fugitivi TaxID=265522 RepID=A2Q0E8_9VIRU|nr:b13.3 [Ichnoviriform fugitivi]BAF45663.1 b13.3 [Ichnoviriform fugitivi]